MGGLVVKGAFRPGLGRPQDHPHWGLTLHWPGKQTHDNMGKVKRTAGIKETAIRTFLHQCQLWTHEHNGGFYCLSFGFLSNRVIHYGITTYEISNYKNYWKLMVNYEL